MNRKILFIFAFALLLLIFLNNNSFANSLSELPSSIVNNMTEEIKQDFESYNYFCLVHFETGSYRLFISDNVIKVKYPYSSSYNSYVVASANTYFYQISKDDGSFSKKYTNSSSYLCSSFPVYSANCSILNIANNEYIYTYIPPYTITYNLNGGIGTSHSDTVQQGNSVTLWDAIGVTPPTNKQFAGWATTDSATIPDVSSPYTPTGNITLYAVYETTAVFYTISYNLNGGTGTNHTDTVQEGNSITLWNGSGITPPEDMNFVGWSTYSNSSVANVESPYTPTEDITFYAVYEYNTSGFLSGIRNVISSITNGFSAIGNAISNITNFLDPDSLDTSDTEDSINNTTTDIRNKFNFADNIKQNVDDMVDVITDTESAPTFTVNVNSERYSGEVTVIDLSWYAPYKEYGDTIICIFAYLSFLWRIFIKLPSIIHGGEASSYAPLMIGDREAYDKTGFGRSWTLNRR